MMIFGAFALLVYEIIYLSFSSYDCLCDIFPSQWWKFHYVEAMLVALVYDSGHVEDNRPFLR